MQFTFNSLDELTEFLEWISVAQGAQFTEAPVLGAAVNVSVKQAEQLADALADTVDDDDDGNNHINLWPQTGDGEQSAEPTKRKRRTKAEMEAARIAEATTSTPSEPVAMPTTAEGMPPSANPFAAVAAVPAPPAAMVETRNADGSVTTAPAQTPAVEPVSDVVTQKAHLEHCKSFIAAKGLGAYNDTVKAVGATNVLAFTDEQRAMHVAIMTGALA
jgi:hypothetical protein